MTRFGLLIVLIIITASPLTSQAPQQLGRFSLQGFEGTIQIEFHDQQADVVVGVGKRTPKPVPTRNVQMWLLSRDGTSLAELRRFPAAGEEARMAFEGGDSQLIRSRFQIGIRSRSFLALRGNIRSFRSATSRGR